ncbi:DNA primase [Streptomyces sp. GSL17-111]|uniref:DNA primase n=1 Tax=Streptomyces sp. GSL17-111 TaxID=3121596 RepID=UPI0030F40289
MAGRINDDDVRTVRDAVPIDTVVSEYLQLRPAGGGNLKGLCPFHDEKSPSFHVSTAKGLFHCFGCQEGGDTLAFLMKVDHLTFSEAVERLAAQAGITLRYEEGGYGRASQQGERTRLIEAHKAAVLYYAEQLDSPEAEAGRRFLAERGFDQGAARHFDVGYAPAGWDHLTRFLRGRGFTDKELVLSGLSQEGRRGPIDRFRGRLMWPIRDISGEVVGFGARRLREDDNGPKYLNTPETPIYRKSQVLYGIDLAKRDIAKEGRAVVVEGYTDVMACHLAGVTTAIATSGTAFGEGHIKILRRILMDNSRTEVIFTFDGDAAGQKAALRAFEDDQKFAARTSIAISPGGMDPCDLRLAKGDTAVQELIDSRSRLFEFALRSVVDEHDLDSAEGRSAALEAAAPIVAQLKDPSLQHEYAVRLAGLLGVLDTQFVVRRIGQIAKWKREGGGRQQRPRADRAGEGPGGRTPAPPPGPAPGRLGPSLHLRSPAHLVERELLKLALQYPALVAPTFDAYGADEFTAEPYAVVRGLIETAGGTEAADADYLDRVRDAAPDDTVRKLITELAVESPRNPGNGAPDEAYAGEQLVAVRLAAVRARVAELEGSARRLDAQGRAEESAAVWQELWVLEQYATALRAKGASAL